MNEKEEFLKTFGIYVKYLREQKGWTQDELAEKCGYTSNNRKSTIAKIEAGKSDLPASKIKTLANTLGVSPLDLLEIPSESLIDYYDESIDKIVLLLSNSGYEVHFENYSFHPLVIIEKSNKLADPQVFAVYEADLLSKYENLCIEREKVSAEDLIENTVVNTMLLSTDEEQLLSNYQKLNDTGKTKAQEDIEDLTMLPKYTEIEDDISYVNAAHTRTDVPFNTEDFQHDEDIMDDDNF